MAANCCRGAAFNQEQMDRNLEINRKLKEDRKKIDSEVKLLLLGAGESGKSTIAKQMKIIHLNGFTDEERQSYRSLIFNNILTGIRTLIAATKELKEVKKDKPLKISKSIKDSVSRLADPSDEYVVGPLSAETVGDVKAVWADKAIQTAYSRASEFQLNDSVAYYFDAIDRIAAANYIPTDEDILRTRAKTTGIIETEFEWEGTRFKMADVGGQRSERKKWMHCFQDVTGVLFCVALSEYDLKLYEDDTTNRMDESLKLFKEICNSKWFIDTAMIVFLNKMDLFEEKIKKTPLTVCFKDFSGSQDYLECREYIKDKFIAQNENTKKPIYCHFTCATETNNVQMVFLSVKDVILRKALDTAGIL